MEKTRDISKLPKWVRQRLDVAEIQIKECDKRLSELAGDSETDVYYRVGVEEKPLPKGSRIRFSLSEGYIDCNVADDKVEICASERLIIQPRAANVVEVLNARLFS